MTKFKKNRMGTLANGRSYSKEKQFLVLPYEMITHPKFQKLSGAAVKVVLELGRHHTGFNNRKIACSCDMLAQSLCMGKATALRALNELIRAGFIVCIKKGRFMGRLASEWEITFLRSEGYQPTHSWKDPEQRPHRPHLAPVKQDLIQEIQLMLEEENEYQVLVPNAKTPDGSESEP